ncbi:hypothetical protein ACI2IX_20185 [Leifsonia aquatica]|uniref:hypothetical protein n=1 Tax=Leifsonia aquatica TaxID=144185 RepID=UPI00384CC72A
MPRTDLSALLQKIDTEDVEPVQRPTEPPASPETPAPAAKVEAPASSLETESAMPRKRQSTRAKKAPTVDTAATSEPLYLRLVRKETRLREEQYETLTEYARKLNRAKAPGAGERITENTLIRIAIDLLIPHLSEMHGKDEAELRESVTNRV